MQVRLLAGARETAVRFEELAIAADSIWIATAWGSSETPVMPALLKAQSRGAIERLVVGLDFNGTHPRFLREMRLSISAVEGDHDSTFHPKIYLFQHGSHFDAIVGSSNLTRGGFERNTEANMQITGSTSDDVFSNLQKEITRMSKAGHLLSEKEISAYEAQWRASRLRKHDEGEDSFNAKPFVDEANLASSRLSVDWPGYVELLRQAEGKRHSVFPRDDGRSYLEAIGELRALFASKGRLINMSDEERRNVAGLRHSDKFAFFGTTSSVGQFSALVLHDPGLLDNALDCIPLPRSDVVARRDYVEFMTRFREVARSLPSPQPGMACASRLLAMKRPDVFVCVNGLNSGPLAGMLGFQDDDLRSTSGYWRLCETIWAMPWCGALPPTERIERDVWDARVALLDAVSYDE
jgi:HKD family nuclease